MVLILLLTSCLSTDFNNISLSKVSANDNPNSKPHTNNRVLAPQFLPLTAELCLGNSGPCIKLEVALGPNRQRVGLQKRPPLAPLRGMLFPQNPARAVKFWMHQTPAPLDMIFIHDQNVVAVIEHAPPCQRLPCPSYGPVRPVDAVLEIGAGQAAALGIQVGSPLKFRQL